MLCLTSSLFPLFPPLFFSVAQAVPSRFFRLIGIQVIGRFLALFIRCVFPLLSLTDDPSFHGTACVFFNNRPFPFLPISPNLPLDGDPLRRRNYSNVCSLRSPRPPTSGVPDSPDSPFPLPPSLLSPPVLFSRSDGSRLFWKCR